MHWAELDVELDDTSTIYIYVYSKNIILTILNGEIARERGGKGYQSKAHTDTYSGQKKHAYTPYNKNASSKT